MLAIKQSLLLILILTSSISEAQTGRLIFYTKPNKGIVKIDTFLLNQEGKTYNVDTGKYIIQVWAPTSKLITDTILIKPNQLTLYRKKLPLSKEFIENNKQTSRYNRPIRVTLIYTALASALYLTNRISLNDNFKKAEREKELYEKNISLEIISLNKKDYDNYKKKYKLHQHINNTLVVSSALLIPSGLLWNYLLHKKINKPHYSEQPLLSNTELSLKTNYNDCISFMLTHKF